MHSLDQFFRILYGCGYREKVEVGVCVCVCVCMRVCVRERMCVCAHMSLKPLKHPIVHLVAAAVNKVNAFYWHII